MTTTHRLAMLAAAVATAAGVAAALPATAGAAPASVPSCDLSQKVLELQAWDRNNQWNIIVWKESASASNSFNDVVVSGSDYYHECKNLSKQSNYYWRVFKTGTFVHKGDGGFRNYAYSGHFTKDGETITFLNP
jgi:hypothetical protein